MRSQRWKILIIKSPILRRIRTSLRIILVNAVHDELKRLNKLRDLYRQQHQNGKIVPSQRKREGYIVQESNKLLQAWTYSLLSCGQGAACISIKENKLSPDIATLGEDMVWNLVFKRWNCIKCYNTFFRTNNQKKKLQEIHRQKEKEEKAFDEWLSNQI